MTAYWYLLLAVITEVIVPSALKSAEEFTKLIPSTIVVVGYLSAFYFIMLVLRTLPVDVTYAIWSGVGIVFVTITGIVLYDQTPDAPTIIGMTLVVY
jgi:small multidrug resistance pump